MANHVIFYNVTLWAALFTRWRAPIDSHYNFAVWIASLFYIRQYRTVLIYRSHRQAHVACFSYVYKTIWRYSLIIRIIQMINGKYVRLVTYRYTPFIRLQITEWLLVLCLFIPQSYNGSEWEPAVRLTCIACLSPISQSILTRFWWNFARTIFESCGDKREIFIKKYYVVQKLDHLTCSKFEFTTFLYKPIKLVKLKFVFSPKLHYMPDGLTF